MFATGHNQHASELLCTVAFNKATNHPQYANLTLKYNHRMRELLPKMLKACKEAAHGEALTARHEVTGGRPEFCPKPWARF